jgi:RimJ/RimL family protein N-acetyltransferase
MLGVDAEGIAAVAHLGFDLDHRDFMIYAVARAVRCAGLGYGRAAVQVALDICQATKTEQRLDARVYAKVHRQNMASLSVLAGFDFEYVRVFGDGYELWVRELA